jgi:DNA polymerase III delta prime subunit
MIRKRDHQFIWTEAYRPTTVTECILPDAVKKIFLAMEEKKEINNLLLHGPPGSGKTTVAKALCDSIGAEYLFINGSKDNGIDVLRTKVQDYASSMSLSGGPKVVIFDEADFLNLTSTQPALRAFIEDFAQTCRFILTCNYPNRIMDAVQSRLVSIDFTIPKEEKKRIAAEIFQRSLDILNLEGVVYTKQVVAELVKRNFPDFRRTLNQMQGLSSNGELNEDSLVDINQDFGVLVKALKTNQFDDLRSWVTKSPLTNTPEVYTRLYDELVSETKDVSALVVLLADYAYKSSFVADKELNLTACLVDIMASCSFT